MFQPPALNRLLTFHVHEDFVLTSKFKSKTVYVSVMQKTKNSSCVARLEFSHYSVAAGRLFLSPMIAIVM